MHLPEGRVEAEEEEAGAQGEAEHLGKRPLWVGRVHQGLGRGASCGVRGITMASRVEVPKVKFIPQKRCRLVKHLEQ